MSKIFIPSRPYSPRCRLSSSSDEKPHFFSFNFSHGQSATSFSCISVVPHEVSYDKLLTEAFILYTLISFPTLSRICPVMNYCQRSSIPHHEQDTLPPAWTMTRPRSVPRRWTTSLPKKTLGRIWRRRLPKNLDQTCLSRQLHTRTSARTQRAEMLRR